MTINLDGREKVHRLELAPNKRTNFVGLALHDAPILFHDVHFVEESLEMIYASTVGFCA